MERYIFDLTKINFIKGEFGETAVGEKILEKEISESVFFSNILEDYVRGYKKEYLEAFFIYFMDFMKPYLNKVISFAVEYCSSKTSFSELKNLIKFN